VSASAIPAPAAWPRSGNPNGGGRPNWPAYTPAGDGLIEFTAAGTVTPFEPDPLKARLDLVQAYMDRKATR